MVADLKQDATTAGIITAIEELKSGITVPAPVTECPKETAPSQASALNGTYHWEVTKEALMEAGVTNTQAINDASGIQTATIADGSIQITQESTEGPNKGDTHEGFFTYEYDGVTITFHWSQSATNCTSATVQIREDGDLEFSNIVECPEDEAGLLLDQVGLRHWERVG